MTIQKHISLWQAANTRCQAAIWVLGKTRFHISGSQKLHELVEKEHIIKLKIRIDSYLVNLLSWRVLMVALWLLKGLAFF